LFAVQPFAEFVGFVVNAKRLRSVAHHSDCFRFFKTLARCFRQPLIDAHRKTKGVWVAIPRITVVSPAICNRFALRVCQRGFHKFVPRAGGVDLNSNTAACALIKSAVELRRKSV